MIIAKEIAFGVRAVEGASRCYARPRRAGGRTGGRGKGGFDITAIKGRDAQDASTQRQYYLRRNEIVAQLFHGVIAEPSSKFVVFVRTHFPAVHKFFTDFFGQFKGKEVKSLDTFSPGYIAGKAILKKFLDANYEATAAHAKGLQKVLSRFPEMDDATIESVTHLWYDRVSPDTHEAVDAMVTSWREGIDIQTAADRILQVEILRKYGEDSFDGFSSLLGPDGGSYGDAFLAMPWARQVMVGANELLPRIQNAGELLNAQPGIKTKTRLELANQKLHEMSPEEAAKALGFKKGKKYDEAVTYFRGQRNLVKGHGYLKAAVAATITGEKATRTSMVSVITQMYKLDAVMRKWALGHLPYQKGMPMHEPQMSEVQGIKPYTRSRVEGPDNKPQPVLIARKLLSR